MRIFLCGGYRPTSFLARLVLAAALACSMAGAAGAAGSALGPCAGTSDKPQSKIWYNDGFYWAILQTSDGSHFFKLVDGTWVKESFIDARVNSSVDGREDVLWNGTELFVLVYSSTPNLYKYTYDVALDVYDLVAGFPVEFDLASGAETIVLDQDSTGRLWAAYEGGGNVYAAYTTSADHRTWEAPGVVLRSGLNDDDVAAVTRFAGSRIGVFWSDQNRWESAFRYHVDGDAPDVWSSVEIVRSGTGDTDDHLNLATDSAGRVYAVTKDVLNEFAAHRRDTNGTWTTRTNITNGQTGTRPTLMLDEASSKLYVLYTCWSCGSPDPILYRSASPSTLSFGSATTFLSASASLNDVTDMKQMLPAGALLAIAAGGGTAYWNGWGSPPAGNGMDAGDGGSLPPPPPPPPPGPPASAAAATAVRRTAPGIAAEFLFDEPSGDKTADEVDSAQEGTLGAPGPDSADPSRVAGVQGGALHFDGANDYVQVASNAQLAMAGSFTLEAWIRRTAAGSPDVVLAKEGSSGRNYRLRITSSDQLELAWKNAAGTSRATVGTAKLVDGQWHHVAAVHDQTRGEDRLYVDGLQDARRTDAATPGPCTDALLIGARRSSGLKDPFAGDIDLVRISSQAAYLDNFAPPVAYPAGTPTSYVLVTWSVPDTGGLATGYRVFRSTNAEDDELVTPSPITGTSFADFGPVDGVLVYRVSAVNAQGESPRTTADALTYGRGPTPPAAPPEPFVRLARHDEPTAGEAIWALDEGAGGTSADATGHAHGLVLGSATSGDAAEPVWTDGVAGRALHFDGTDDHADTPDDPALRFAASFTVEAWVRIAATGQYGVLVAKESSSAGRNYRLALTATGKLEFQWKTTGGTTQVVTSAAVLPTGGWHHVAGVFDAPAAENRLYLDGQLAARKATTGTPATGAAAVRLGARQSTSLKDFFAGDLDLVRLTAGVLYRDGFDPPRAYTGRQWVEHRITWSEAAQGSARIAGYVVWRSVQDGDWERLNAAATAGLELVAEEPGRVKTCYRVVALDRLALESDASTPHCIYWKPQELTLEPAKASAADAPVALAAGPNPFNPSTTVSLRLADAQPVVVRLFDVRGRVVRTLVDAALPAGEHRFVWDGRGAAGAPVSSGIYLLHVRAGDVEKRLKLILTK